MLAYPQVGVLCLKELEEVMNMCWFSAKLFISFCLIILGEAEMAWDPLERCFPFLSEIFGFWRR